MAGISRLFAKTPNENKSKQSLQIQRKKSSKSLKSPNDRILFLQRTIGNQAVQRLIKSGTLRTKLKIGQPGDIYEQEADRVADVVMRMPEPGVQRQVEPEKEEEETLQSKPLANQITPLVQIQRQEEPEEKEEMFQAKPLAGVTTPLVQRQVEPEEEEEELQAKATSGHLSEVNSNLESHIQSIRGGGQPLSEPDRTFFEPRFGRDFSQVRVHTDTKAEEAASAVNARAFTFGQDVIFRTGEYTPGTIRGNRLLAHELTHIIQQGKTDCKNAGFLSIKRKKRATIPEQKILDKPLSYWRRKLARQGLSKRVLKYLDKSVFFPGKLPLKAIIRSKGIDITFNDGGKIYVDRSKIPLDAYLLKRQIKAERERLKKKEKWYMTIIRWLAPKPTLKSSVKHRADWELSDRLFIIRKIAKGWSLKAVLAKLHSLNIANFKFIVISASVVPLIAAMGIMPAGGKTTVPTRIKGTSGRAVGATGGALGGGVKATLKFLEGGTTTGTRTILVDTTSGRVLVGGLKQRIHIQVFEAAGLKSHIGIVGGFGRFKAGNLVSFELSSGTFAGTQAEINLAMTLLRALAGK